MKTTLFILFFLMLCITGFSQSFFGFQQDIGFRELRSVAQGGIKHSVTTEFYIARSLLFRKSLSPVHSLEMGLGYRPLSQEIRMELFSTAFSELNLRIKLHYLTIPLSFNYSIPFNNKSSLLFTGSMETGFLLSKSDNYQDIINPNSGLVDKDWYSKVLFMPGLATAYQANMKNCVLMEFGIFVSIDMNRWIKEEEFGGFYYNLSPSRSIRYGIQVKYFLDAKSF